MNKTFTKKANIYPKNKIIPSTYILGVPSISSKLSCTTERTFRSRPKSNPKTKFISDVNNFSSSFSGVNVLYEANYMKNIFDGMSTMNKMKNIEESNNLLGYQKLLSMDQEKNKKQNKSKFSLNKRINDLEFQLTGKNFTSEQQDNTYNSNNYSNNYNFSSNYNNYTNSNVNEEILKLKKENQELKNFKQKVYNFSMRYDEINENILNCLKSLDAIINMLSNGNISQNYEINFGEIQKTSDNFKEILNYLVDFISIKQDEYNSLLQQKEFDNLKLQREIEKLNNINNNNTVSFNNRKENNYKNDDFNKTPVNNYGKNKFEFNKNNNNELNYDFGDFNNIRNNKKFRTIENFYNENFINNNNQNHENRQNSQLKRLNSIKNSLNNILNNK